MQQDLIVACNLISTQLQLHSLHLASCTYYFTLDSSDNLNLLFPTHIKLKNSSSYLFYDSRLLFPAEYLAAIATFNGSLFIRKTQVHGASGGSMPSLGLGGLAGLMNAHGSHSGVVGMNGMMIGDEVQRSARLIQME